MLILTSCIQARPGHWRYMILLLWRRCTFDAATKRFLRSYRSIHFSGHSWTTVTSGTSSFAWIMAPKNSNTSSLKRYYRTILCLYSIVTAKKDLVTMLDTFISWVEVIESGPLHLLFIHPVVVLQHLLCEVVPPVSNYTWKKKDAMTNSRVTTSSIHTGLSLE